MPARGRGLQLGSVHVLRLLLLLALALAAAPPRFSPARLVRGDAPAQHPLAVGWASEFLVVQVGSTGRVRHIEAAGSASLLAGAVARWEFDPAHDGVSFVPTEVLVAAVFRPSTYPDQAPPPDLTRATGGIPGRVPRPVRSAAPPYPANHLGNAVVIVEIAVAEDGRVTGARVVSPASGFDQPARAAAEGWRFEPARRDGRQVPAFVYIVFGFRQPVVGHGR